MAGRVVDLSHPIEHDMVTYPGLPGPVIGDHLSFEQSRGHYAPGVEFQIGSIWLVSNTGTYLDTPAHRIAEAADLADVRLEQCVDLPAVVVDAEIGTGPIQPRVLRDVAVQGAAVLFRTGWDRLWRTPPYGDVDHPHLAEATAELLVERRAALVGIDSVNIDGTSTGERPVHTALLAAGILIVEHLTGLEQLPRSGARFTAVPPPIRGMGSFPVRALALLP
jgi:kynurenine formamidase